MDDFDETLAAAQDGAGWAIESIFTWLGAPVAAYLRARRAEDPDDLANEVFVRTFRNLGAFRGDVEQFRSWIFSIAHNAALDDQRRLRRRPRVVEGAAVCEPMQRDAADDVIERLALERVQALIDELAPDQRDVFLLRVLGDLSVAQTAAVLGKTYEAVKALQRRGAAALKRQLIEEPVPK
jgi:RNA polymerase sigma factor (sigma-70 family)